MAVSDSGRIRRTVTSGLALCLLALAAVRPPGRAYLRLLSLIAEVHTGQMAQLIVRNIADDLVRALKRRAVRHGRSAEAEHREILRSVLTQDAERESFKAFLTSMPDVGSDEDFDFHRDLPRAIP